MTTKFPAFLARPALFVLLQPILAFAQTTQPPSAWDYPGPWHMWSGGWGFWWIFPLMMLFMFIVCAFFMITMMGRHWGHHHSGEGPAGSALKLLQERFARGEIQKEEYEEKKAILLR